MIKSAVNALMLGETDNIVWSLRDDKLLRYAVETFGVANWNKISKTVGKRTPSQCQVRWAYLLARDADTKDPKKGTWSRDEDEMLRQLMEAVPHRNWGDVAALIPGRSAKQCRERWCYNLDPSINKDVWTDEEDKILLDNQRKLGNRWAFIASMLPGRTENAVKTRFKSIMRAKRREWHHDEDVTIIEMHRQVGSKWDKIAEKLPNRTKNAVRTRYRQLMKEAKGIQEAPNEFGNYGKRAAIMKKCNELQKSIEVEKLLLQLGDHCKLNAASKQGKFIKSAGLPPSSAKSPDESSTGVTTKVEKTQKTILPSSGGPSPQHNFNQVLQNAAAQGNMHGLQQFMSHQAAPYFYSGQPFYNPATGQPYMYPFYPLIPPIPQQQAMQYSKSAASPDKGKDAPNDEAAGNSSGPSVDMPAAYSQQAPNGAQRHRRGSKRTATDQSVTLNTPCKDPNGSLWAVAAAADSLDKQDTKASNLVYPTSTDNSNNRECIENGRTFGNLVPTNAQHTRSHGHVAKKRRPSVQDAQDLNAVSSLRKISASPVQT